MGFRWFLEVRRANGGWNRKVHQTLSRTIYSNPPKSKISSRKQDAEVFLLDVLLYTAIRAYLHQVSQDGEGEGGRAESIDCRKNNQEPRREVLQLEGDFLARTASTETLLLVVIGEAADA